jgi:hypothetical protein
MEKKPLKNNNDCMMVSPQRGLRCKLITDAFFSTLSFNDNSAMKAPPFE